MAIGTALVTGASSGIGEVYARRLAQRNWNLVLVARRQERLEAIGGALAESYDIRCEVIPADLSEPDAPQRIFESCQEKDLRIDYLVNNAGIGLSGRFASQDYERLAAMMRLNIDSLTRLTHLFLPGMLKIGRGTIVNVASMAALQPVPYFAVYAGTKAYVLHFTEALAEELRGSGVIVSCLCPGSTATEFGDVAGMDPAFARFAYVPPEAVVDPAIRAIERGDTLVAPGLASQLQLAAVRLAPRSITRRVLGMLFERATRR